MFWVAHITQQQKMGVIVCHMLYMAIKHQKATAPSQSSTLITRYLLSLSYNVCVRCWQINSHGYNSLGSLETRSLTRWQRCATLSRMQNAWWSRYACFPLTLKIHLTGSLKTTFFQHSRDKALATLLSPASSGFMQMPHRLFKLMATTTDPYQLVVRCVRGFRWVWPSLLCVATYSGAYWSYNYPV